MGFYEWITVTIALAAIIVSVITSARQISLYLKELRPFLSFTGSWAVIAYDPSNGKAPIDFVLHFKNTGKCILEYSVTKFEICINGEKLRDVTLSNHGGVVGLNAEASFRQYYNNYLTLAEGLSDNQVREQVTLPNYTLDFAIEYFHLPKGRRFLWMSPKKYLLSYTVSVKYHDKIRREFYEKSYAT